MFNIGDIVYTIENPNKLYKVLNVDNITTIIPNYNLIGEDGILFEIFCLDNWRKLVNHNDVLRYGDVLTDESFRAHNTPKDNYVRIRTIQYESRIFYHKMINGEVVEFKELTV